jgi:tetratricopeptide (TPR) repeat protein
LSVTLIRRVVCGIIIFLGHSMVKILKRYLGYTGVLCLAVALAVFFLMDARQMKLYRLDDLNYCWSYPILFSQGQEGFNPQELHASLIYYKIASDVAPAPYRTYEMQGYCYFLLKDYSRSREMFKKALQLSPRSFWLEFDLAMIAYKQGHCETAAPLLKHILQGEAQEQCQGALLSLLKGFLPKERTRLLLEIPTFVNEVRVKSLVLLSCCSHCKDLDRAGVSISPVMHPWSSVITPGKEGFYD